MNPILVVDVSIRSKVGYVHVVYDGGDISCSVGGRNCRCPLSVERPECRMALVDMMLIATCAAEILVAIVAEHGRQCSYWMENFPTRPLYE